MRIDLSPTNLILVRLALWATLFAGTFSSQARAHEGTAEPPDFGTPACISVVEAGEEAELAIDYTVMRDDTELMEGDIRVDDAKTHQFFAFRGALHARELSYELYPFDPSASEPPLRLPTWISTDDVKRAANATGAADGTGFSADLVAPDEVLVDSAELTGLWLRITADAGRRPITREQAANDIRWPLAGVEPGIYTVAGYIFSPPYNGWATRPGVVKITRDGADPPAAVVASIRDIVRGAQGRRISVCVDAPEGTRVRGEYLVEERPDDGYRTFLAERPLSPDEQSELDLCFVNPQPELSGSVRIRLSLVAPDGTTTSAYSPNTLTVLGSEAGCTEVSNARCCPEGARPQEPAAADGGLASPGNTASRPAGSRRWSRTGRSNRPRRFAGLLDRDGGGERSPEPRHRRFTAPVAHGGAPAAIQRAKIMRSSSLSGMLEGMISPLPPTSRWVPEILCHR